ncbi:MAG TPA: hypothetical protein DDW45_02520 [Gammaproteobacteria bacterium]|nr:hypothetical protein [Gammaproteobacteria bacterium]
MSIFIVPPDYIAHIAIATAEESEGINMSAARQNAETLIDANIKSISARYPDMEGQETEMFTSMPEKEYRAAVGAAIHELLADPYFSPEGRKFVTACIDAVSIYDHNTCEFEGYRESAAYLLAMEAGTYCALKMRALP